MIRPNLLRNTPYILQFIFEGQVYNAFKRDTLAATGTAGDTGYLQIKTNGGKITHLISASIASNSEQMRLDLIEAPTVTDGTTEVVSHQYDRRWNTIGKTADAELFADPTGVSGGSIIDSDTAYGVGTAGGFKSASTATQTFIERPLKENTDYLIEIQNFDSVEADYLLKLNFYESGN